VLVAAIWFVPDQRIERVIRSRASNTEKDHMNS
jgi:hypothetical protein